MTYTVIFKTVLGGHELKKFNIPPKTDVCSYAAMMVQKNDESVVFHCEGEQSPEQIDELRRTYSNLTVLR